MGGTRGGGTPWVVGRTRATILAAVAFLETDPYFEKKPGGLGYSYAFEKLKERNFPIRVFRLTDARNWRVFYYVDERAKVVLIKELIGRRADTYWQDTSHVTRLMKNDWTWIKGRIE